jgi:hypothetical protein
MNPNFPGDTKCITAFNAINEEKIFNIAPKLHYTTDPRYEGCFRHHQGKNTDTQIEINYSVI